MKQDQEKTFTIESNNEVEETFLEGEEDVEEQKVEDYNEHF